MWETELYQHVYTHLEVLLQRPGEVHLEGAGPALVEGEVPGGVREVEPVDPVALAGLDRVLHVGAAVVGHPHLRHGMTHLGGGTWERHVNIRTYVCMNVERANLRGRHPDGTFELSPMRNKIPP